MSALLQVDGLRVQLPTAAGMVTIVNGVDYSVEPGEVFGVAGESGSGKTISMLALMGLLPAGAVTDGSARFGGNDLLRLKRRELRDVCGREIAMVFQDPMTSLHPMLTVGKQLTEHLRRFGHSRAAAGARAVELLDQVRIPDPRSALAAYPHQFSGGMRQRIAIAIALAAGPSLLIADEPTTALDVTVQAGILRLLDRLRRENDLSVVLITHDLGVMSAIADRISIFYAGASSRRGSARTCSSARATRTRARCSTRCRIRRPSTTRRSSRSTARRRARSGFRPAARSTRAARTRSTSARRSIRRSSRWTTGAGSPATSIPSSARERARAPGRRGRLRAARQPERARGRRREPHRGARADRRPRRRVRLREVEPRARGRRPRAGFGRDGEFEAAPSRRCAAARGPRELAGLQMVFQNPYSSLNPRRRIGSQLRDALDVLELVPRNQRRARVAELLELVGLPASAAGRFPHQFSGGQRQRIAIARSLAADPSVLVLDEPLASLDASAQAQIANLLVRLSRELSLSLLLISHDLAIVRHVADAVSVMYLGRMVETAPTHPLWTLPLHPYTEALIAAVPHPDGSGFLPAALPGEVPDPARPPSGCRFQPALPLRLRPLPKGRAAADSGRRRPRRACWLQSPGAPHQLGIVSNVQ